MLPPEYRTSRLDTLQARLEALGEEPELEPMLENDFGLIGLYVQLYCGFEFNLRRALAVFESAGLPGSRSSSDARTNALVDSVITVVRQMDPAIEEVEETESRLAEIERRRPWRNVLAHWAGARLPGEDALVFRTNDPFDEQQISGERCIVVDTARYAIVDLADLRGLEQHLIPYEHWLAAKVESWRCRYGNPLSA